MKSIILIALVAVASAKPLEKVVEKVAVPKDGVIYESKMTPVGYSAGLAYPVAHSLYTPIQYVQPAVVAKNVEVKTYTKPLEVKTYAKPVEMVKPVTYVKPIVSEVKPLTYVKPIVPEVKPLTYVKPVEVKTYAKPIQMVKPIVSEVKPFETKIVSPITYTAPVAATPVVQKKLTYAYQPVETQFVPKPYEIPVKKVEYVPEKTGCTNSFGDDVPCRKSKREADHHIKMIDTPLTYSTMPVVASPYYYNTAAAVVPSAVATQVEYKALPKKVNKIEVPQPYYKEYIEQVPLKPNCRNNYGVSVPCNDYY